MEQRLRPLNALIGLVTPGDVNPAALTEAGFQLEGLEVPVSGDAGKVTVDALLFDPAESHFVLCEVKSGANADPAQARKYSAIEPEAVVAAAHVTLRRRAPLTAEAVYVCLGEHVERIKQSLDSAGTRLPVLGIHEDMVTLDHADAATEHLAAAFDSGPIPLRAPPSRIIPFDHDSRVEEVEPFVKAQLVAELANRRREITIRGLAERTAQHFGLYGRVARQQIQKRVGEAASRIALGDPETFEYLRPTGSREGLVRLLKTPEAHDPRGRTQGYQALARRRHTGRRGSQQDPNQLDLLRELTQADEMADEGDVNGTQEEEEMTP